METNIYQKLQNVRVKVGEKCTKKSGHNPYAGFDYFTLDDFLPIANKCFAEVGLCPVFNINKKKIVRPDGEVIVLEESATLVIYDGESFIEFTSPVAEVIVGKNPNPIQNLGAQHTYLKRYLYMNALELSEGDVIDATAGKRATPEQVEMIIEIYDSENLNRIKEFYHVDTINDLTVQQASQVIAQKKRAK